jgi:hypothetical protein
MLIQTNCQFSTLAHQAYKRNNYQLNPRDQFVCFFGYFCVEESSNPIGIELMIIYNVGLVVPKETVEAF